MKRLLIVLAVLALLLGAAVPTLAETTLLSWNGFELQIQGYSVREGDDYDSALRLNVRAINNTGHCIWLHAENAMVDGTSVYTAGVSGISVGADMTDFMLFKPNKDNAVGGDGAIRTGSQIDMTLILDDNDSYDELYRQDVHINLNSLTSGGGQNGSSPASTYTGGSYANTAPAYRPSSTDYKTLKKGSKGQAVRDLQQRLTDLGYLNDRVDGVFGQNTTTAVRSFLSQHGMDIGNEATPAMQELLYSDRAQYYVEPYLPLMIGPTYKQETPQQTGIDNTGMMNILLVNRSSTRGIRGYVLSYYQTDMYGTRIDPYGIGLTHFEFEEMNYIEPGYYKDAFTFTIERYYNTYAVYVGVQKVVFDDGEVHEVGIDDVVYYECAIQR